MGFKTEYKILETRVDDFETYYDDDFTRMILFLKDDRYVHFELPKYVEVNKGDKLLFYNCKLKLGGHWYMDNKSYELLEIFSKDAKDSYFKLKGSEAIRLERSAARRFAAEKSKN